MVTKQTEPTLNFYDVILSRNTAEEISIRVEARNMDEAENLAREQAENDFDLTWNPTDYIGDVQIDQIDIVFPNHRNADEEKPAERIFNAGEAPQTNMDAVIELMTYSRYGELAQAFVMDALVKFSKTVLETPSEIWKGVAAEINQKLARYQGK